MSNNNLPPSLEEKMDALLETMAENTTTLNDVQKQAAATSASTKDSRIYVKTIAKNTSWAENGSMIAGVLSTALKKDHVALHAARDAAEDMRSQSNRLIDLMHLATENMKFSQSELNIATQRLYEAKSTLEAGRPYKIAGIAIIAALCGAVGYFAREPASKFQHLWDAGIALKENAAHSDCDSLGGKTMPSGDRLACVIWQDPS